MEQFLQDESSMVWCVCVCVTLTLGWIKVECNSLTMDHLDEDLFAFPTNYSTI